MIQENKARGNYYWVFLYRLGVVMLMYLICRFLFYFFNRPLFTGISFGDWLKILKGGFVFDIAAMVYINALFIVMMILPFPFRENRSYQKVLKYIFLITNSIAILANCIDFIYYRFTLRRTTLSVFSEFKNEVNGKQLFINFFRDYWYILIVFIALVLLMAWLYNLVSLRSSEIRRKSMFYLKAPAVFLASIALSVGGVRGDFKYSTRPITISNAGEYVNKPHEVYLVLNTPFCLIRTLRNNPLEKMNYYGDDELRKIYSPVHYPADSLTGSMKKDNVVIIILESFGKESLGGYNHDLDNGKYKGYTPFLDSLMNESLVYWNSFANGRKSIDALPSVLASIPSGNDPFVITPYASDSIRSLPALLKDEGYHTSFFHGAPNGSMGFKALVNLLGVEQYYGKDEYNNDKDFDGIWGIWDEPFFQFFGQKLKTFQQPFFSTIFSVSSHHPFKVPQQYQGVFKKGPLPLYECIGYTDMALRKFFDSIKNTDWFNHTLFVISADHSSLAYHPVYEQAWGQQAIPILFYHPGDNSLKKIDSSVVQQIDVMPTVLDYLHYNKPYFAYGENVFSKNRLNFAFDYSGGYRWFQDNYLLLFDGKKANGLFDYTKDRMQMNNLLSSKQEIAQKMERDLKAFIQQYNNRLIENRLTAAN